MHFGKYEEVIGDRKFDIYSKKNKNPSSFSYLTNRWGENVLIGSPFT